MPVAPVVSMIAPMPRRIAVLAFEGCQSLDVLGPIEVFHGATERLLERQLQDGAHEVERAYTSVVVGLSRESVRSESGVRLLPDLTLEECLEPGELLDTLVLAGGPGIALLARDRDALARIGQLAKRARRVVSVCTGAFILAALGLLDGRRATTHWAYCDQLQSLFPRVQVERSPLFVRDVVWTSAGVTAGVDLSLALVEQDFGQELASEVARWLVVFMQRSSNQPQLSAPLALQSAERMSLRDLVTWLVEHPTNDLSVAVMAKRCGMSVRNFARLFRAQLGVTPARFVTQVRSEYARRLLEGSRRSIDEVASTAGFASGDALRRALRRTTGEAPSVYRRRLERAK